MRTTPPTKRPTEGSGVDPESEAMPDANVSGDTTLHYTAEISDAELARRFTADSGVARVHLGRICRFRPRDRRRARWAGIRHGTWSSRSILTGRKRRSTICQRRPRGPRAVPRVRATAREPHRQKGRRLRAAAQEPPVRPRRRSRLLLQGRRRPRWARSQTRALDRRGAQLGADSCVRDQADIQVILVDHASRPSFMITRSRRAKTRRGSTGCFTLAGVGAPTRAPPPPSLSRALLLAALAGARPPGATDPREAPGREPDLLPRSGRRHVRPHRAPLRQHGVVDPTRERLAQHLYAWAHLVGADARAVHAVSDAAAGRRATASPAAVAKDRGRSKNRSASNAPRRQSTPDCLRTLPVPDRGPHDRRHRRHWPRRFQPRPSCSWTQRTRTSPRRRPQGHAGARWPRVEIVKGDVRDRASLVKAFAGARIVYHLAARISIIGEQRGLVRAINVGGVATQRKRPSRRRWSASCTAAASTRSRSRISTVSSTRTARADRAHITPPTIAPRRAASTRSKW